MNEWMVRQESLSSKVNYWSMDDAVDETDSGIYVVYILKRLN